MSAELPFDAGSRSGGSSDAPVEGRPVELLGTVQLITYRNEENSYTVARLETDAGGTPVSVVGTMAGVEPGDTVLVRGKWTIHRTYGAQVDLASCELRPPAGRRGLVKFLGGGRIKGVGPKTAERIVDALGLDVLDRLARHPNLLQTVPGIGREKARVIIAQLEEQRHAAVALVFLQDHGLGGALAMKVFRAYGVRTIEVVRDNPYRLADEVLGVGFRTADILARNLGHDPDSGFRIAAGLRFLLGQAALEGHTGLPPEMLVQKAAAFLEVDEQRVESVLVDALGGARGGQGAHDDGDSLPELVEEELVYRRDLWAAEGVVADGLRRLLADPSPLVDWDPDAAVAETERDEGLELAPDQREALRLTLTSRVSVITGGPGVGKTTIVRGLVRILRSQGRLVELAAPTGRAARRLAEATGSEASTLHRLLGLIPGAGGFRTIRDEPLVLDVLVVDEISMVDIQLMAAVLDALPADAGLVLVGDVDQLPSVGPGEVLRDLIESGMVPVARLTTIFRQAAHSGIVRVAHELNAGEIPQFDDRPDGQAFFIERDDPVGAVAAIKTMVQQRIPRAFGLDPLLDVQVITPVHAGPVGTVALNDGLREVLNPPRPDKAEIERFGRKLRAGDKVMQIRNNYDLLVFNGDIGHIEALDPDEGLALVRFDERGVEYELDDLDQLVPAFAITCHKSQGSEFPAVVMPLFTAHFVMLRRNLVYTAVTRAKQVLVLVGEPRALQIAATTPGSGQRHTRLTERLRD